MENKKLIICSSERVLKREDAEKFAERLINLDFKTRIIPYIKKRQRSSLEVVIVPLDELSERELKRSDIHFNPISKYLKDDLYDSVEEEAMNLIVKCDIFEKYEKFTDAGAYKDIYLWEMLNLDLWGMIREILKKIKLIEEIIEIEKPQQIVVSDSIFTIYNIVIPIGNINKIPVSRISIEIFPKVTYFIQKILNNYVVHIINKTKKMRKQLRLEKRKIPVENPNNVIEGKKRKIIVFSDTIRHLNLISPWIQEFQKNPDNGVLIIGVKEEWKKKYEKMGIEYVTFDSYINKNIKKTIRKNSKKILKEWHNIKDDERFYYSMFYHNIPIYPLMKEKLFLLLPKRFFGLEEIGFIKLVDTLEKIVEIEKPHIIFLMDFHYWFEKTIILYCHIHGIKTIMLQHGLHTGRAHDRYVPITKLALFGDFPKECLLKKGFHNNQIVITGAPQWDKLYQFKADKKDIYKDLNLDTERITIVIATQPLGDENIRIFRDLFDALKKIPKSQLIFKRHPSERGSIIDDIAIEEKIEYKYITTHNYDLHKILYVSDILITVHSTVAIEAMVLKKPVIIMKYYPGKDKVPYSKEGSAIQVKNKEELFEAIYNLINNKEFKNRLLQRVEYFIYRHAYKIDGKASIRVCKNLEDLCDTKSNVFKLNLI